MSIRESDKVWIYASIVYVQVFFSEDSSSEFPYSHVQDTVATGKPIGIDNIMWSTDYPHPACTFPDSRKLVEIEFEGIPEDERAAIVCGNATRVWDL